MLRRSGFPAAALTSVTLSLCLSASILGASARAATPPDVVVRPSFTYDFTRCFANKPDSAQYVIGRHAVKRVAQAIIRPATPGECHRNQGLIAVATATTPADPGLYRSWWEYRIDGMKRTTTVGTLQVTAAPPSPFPVGLSRQTIDVGRVERSYLVHVPDRATPPRGIILVLHGGGGEGVSVADEGASPLAMFRQVADRENVVAVYPEGLPARDPARRPGWADCRADHAVSSRADDVGFLAALITSLASSHALPHSRIFMAGSSNGAQMTQAFAFHHPELLGAVASNAGGLPRNPLPGPCTDGPSRPIPILLVHGTSDPQMPYGGGCVANIAGACNRGMVISAEATRDRWREINGVDRRTPGRTVVDVDTGDSGPAHRFTYAGPSPVEWWRLDGGGHAAPSRTVAVNSSTLAGIQNRDVEFADIAWEFFADRLRR